MTVFTKNILMIFGSKFSLDINDLVRKPSKTTETFFLTKMGCKHDQFYNLAIDKLFDLLCRSLHHSFSTKT